MRSTEIVEKPLSEGKWWLVYCPLRQLLFLMLSTKGAQTREMPYTTPGILSNKLTFLIVRGGGRFLIGSRQARKFSSLSGSFRLFCLLSWLLILHFWSLRLSLKRAASQEGVVSVLVHKHHSALCSLHQSFFQFWGDVD